MKHPSLPAPTANRSSGFSLIELMVVVAIAAILVSVAAASYQSQVQKSRRTEARTALLDLATREERYFSTNNFYSNLPADMGYGTFTPVGSGYYNVTIAVTPANAGTVPPTQAGYLIKATAIGIQVSDASCQTFTVDQTGTQGSTGTAPVATCWQ
jgi:type IV pilus assembly protein PilE